MGLVAILAALVCGCIGGAACLSIGERWAPNASDAVKVFAAFASVFGPAAVALAVLS